MALTFLILEVTCDLLMPTIMSKIIDIGVVDKNMNYILKMGGVMLTVTGFGAIGAASRNIVSSNVSQKFGADLRADLFSKIQGFSFDNIDNFEIATLVTRLTNDVSQVQNFVHGMMRIFVKAPLLCVGSLIMATMLNPSMSIVLVVVVPIVTLLIIINMKIGYPFFKRVQKSLDGVNAVMREYLAGVRVVKAFNRFTYERKRFRKTNEDLADITTKAMRVTSIFSPSISFTVNLGIVSVLWFGGLKVNNGSMQVGQIIAFINYMTQVLFSLMMISFVFSMFVRARASTERIGEIFAQENSISNLECATDVMKDADLKGRVDFEKVSFSYANAKGEPVLKDISFTFMPGETIGVIGSTGSGKTSLINLIPRFYDVTTGEVKVDGVNVKDLELKELREKIAMVPQKTVLFTGTVMENIRWGREEATIEEIEEVSEIGQVQEFIHTFKEGYHTVLGQGGVNLSGGQKQRISIARALIKKPEILILDDSTSAVDVSTERKIREGLKKHLKGLTTIIIAQRITSVMEADKVIVLDNGRIVGMGNHEELMKNCEVYKEIFRSQIGKEEM